MCMDTHLLCMCQQGSTNLVIPISVDNTSNHLCLSALRRLCIPIPLTNFVLGIAARLLWTSLEFQRASRITTNA